MPAVDRFAIEKLLWRLAGVLPGVAYKRLWLPDSFQIDSDPKLKLAISAIVRNEEPYVDEWLEFHLMMGVEHFFIYDNGSSDGTVSALRKSPHAERITVMEWANLVAGWEGVAGSAGRMQKLAMLHAIANYGHMTEWMAFIDLDEFLYPAKAGTLLDILAAYDELDSLSVYWNMFGTSGHASKPEGLITENFTMRSRRRSGSNKNLCRVKSIVRPRAVRGVHNSHTLILQNGCPESWTETRQRIGFADHRPQYFSDEIVRINHYYSKSKIEYYKRREVPKEGARQDFRRNDDLLDFIEQDTVEDLAIQRFVPELKARLSRNQRTAANGAARPRLTRA